jgi:hypothetical protein
MQGGTCERYRYNDKQGAHMYTLSEHAMPQPSKLTYPTHFMGTLNCTPACNGCPVTVHFCMPFKATANLTVQGGQECAPPLHRPNPT